MDTTKIVEKTDCCLTLDLLNEKGVERVDFRFLVCEVSKFFALIITN